MSKDEKRFSSSSAEPLLSAKASDRQDRRANPEDEEKAQAKKRRDDAKKEREELEGVIEKKTYIGLVS